MDAAEDGSGPCGKQEERSPSNGNEDGSSSSDSDSSSGFIYEGPVYHIGVNRLGHHFCHLRFLRISGVHIEMFKKDPASGAKPARQGVAGRFLKVEDMGRRKINGKDLYVLKISNALGESGEGEIAFRTAMDAQNWRDAFLQAKDEADNRLDDDSGHKSLNEDRFKLNGHRARLRHYAKRLTKIKTIGRGSDYVSDFESIGLQGNQRKLNANNQDEDIFDEHDWRCVRTVNGIRILEDASSDPTDNLVILKSEGVIDASPDAIFDLLMDISSPSRKEWDILTGNLELIEAVDGHCDIVYGTFDPKYLRRRHPKSDFVFSRVWRRDPDNTYSIMQSPTLHKDCPKNSRFHRINLNPTFWEIKPLVTNGHRTSKSRVIQIMEIQSTGWGRWKHKYFAKMDRTMPYVILCQIAGLRDYFAANPAVETAVTQRRDADKSNQAAFSVESSVYASATQEEFYDAMEADISDDDEDDDKKEESNSKKVRSHRFRNTALALMKLTPHARAEASELASGSSEVKIDLNDFTGSLPQATSRNDSCCWIDPGGKDFMVRGKSYLRDHVKISGGEPLFKLLSVDWFCCKSKIDSVATNHRCLPQSDAGKRVPFVLIVNLQVPAEPNYSLVFYFGAEKPISKGSLLDKFVNGSDTFRDSRLKLIPRICKGYWFVKRAVGTKACLLGQSVTCRYIRQDNFLEVDVDIGSSSVANSIISLVLKHVTNLVVDMAILIEGRDESELPEYLLGTTRISKITLESATSYQ